MLVSLTTETVLFARLRRRGSGQVVGHMPPPPGPAVSTDRRVNSG